MRRIGSVGLLHNNNSYAFIGIGGLKAKQRNIAFERLYSEDRIKEVNVEDSKLPFYYKTEDEDILTAVLSDGKLKKRSGVSGSIG